MRRRFYRDCVPGIDIIHDAEIKRRIYEKADNEDTCLY
jgi:hypothetical protein